MQPILSLIEHRPLAKFFRKILRTRVVVPLKHLNSLMAGCGSQLNYIWKPSGESGERCVSKVVKVQIVDSSAFPGLYEAVVYNHVG